MLLHKKVYLYMSEKAFLLEVSAQLELFTYYASLWCLEHRNIRVHLFWWIFPIFLLPFIRISHFGYHDIFQFFNIILHVRIIPHFESSPFLEEIKKGIKSLEKNINTYFCIIYTLKMYNLQKKFNLYKKFYLRTVIPKNNI